MLYKTFYIQCIIIILNDETIPVETHSMRLKHANSKISIRDAFNASLPLKHKDNISNIITVSYCI